MMEPQQVHQILSERVPGAEVTVEDMTGTQDHFFVTVLSPQFKGKSIIQQHQIVNQALADCLEDGRIHALKIKTHPII